MWNHSKVKTYIHTKVRVAYYQTKAHTDRTSNFIIKILNQDEKKGKGRGIYEYMTVYTSTVGYSKSLLIQYTSKKVIHKPVNGW